jgi:hypothetical protein
MSEPIHDRTFTNVRTSNDGDFGNGHSADLKLKPGNSEPPIIADSPAEFSWTAKLVVKLAEIPRMMLKTSHSAGG